ncbi:MAG: hypothetical protein Q9174_000769 [Haloplaca sp. 1 TL-2023]
MPPQRTIPPSKAIKTERTHEENQERFVTLTHPQAKASLISISAYIAASRRSDRSLEARVESARRASEIHKRRTGRSLRVTEQDVVNEEMYEEEDDDLPMQYRRLTAHLQTGSADFNRRLSAYLTNHVAMRSALDQAISNSYAQQYPNAPQFAHNQPGMYPSPFMHQGMVPTPAQSPQSYMQTPFTSANPATFRPGSARPVSMGSQHSPATYVQSPTIPSPVDVTDRRTSSGKSKSASPTNVRTPQSLPARPSQPQVSTSYHVPSDLTSKQVPVSSQPQQFPQTPTSLYSPQETGPLSTTLPQESQMLLGSELDHKDPMASMLMGSNDHFMQSYWGSSMTSPMKSRNFNPSYDGMSTTLAPSALDMPSQQFSYNHNQPPSTMSMPQQSYLPLDSSVPDFNKAFYQMTNSSHGSGTATPAGHDGGWDAFINDNSWADNTI